MMSLLEFASFQVLKWIILLLPLRSVQHLGEMLGSMAYVFMPGRRRIALENLQFAFPEKSADDREAIARGAFRNYGIALTEFLWFPNLNDRLLRRIVRPKNIDIMERGFEKGKGMVMLSGHFGNWELIALGVAYLSRHPFSIIVQTQSNKRIDEVINRHRCLFGNTVIPMGMSVREILKTLQNGGIVAIAPDQSGPMEGVFVDFFGRSVASHQGPAAFALRAGAPMQMGFMVRQPDFSYEVTVVEIPMDDLTENSEENIVELTRRHTAILEDFIRRYPDHWQWMHRRWKHTFESVQREKNISA